MQSNKRRRNHSIHLRLDTLELERITEHAEETGLTLPGYLRAAGLKRRLRSTIDKAHIAEVVRLKADLGRVGGLLKLWIFQEGASRPESPEDVAELARQVEDLVTEIADVINRLDPSPLQLTKQEQSAFPDPADLSRISNL